MATLHCDHCLRRRVVFFFFKKKLKLRVSVPGPSRGAGSRAREFRRDSARSSESLSHRASQRQPVAKFTGPPLPARGRRRRAAVTVARAGHGFSILDIRSIRSHSYYTIRSIRSFIARGPAQCCHGAAQPGTRLRSCWFFFQLKLRVSVPCPSNK